MPGTNCTAHAPTQPLSMALLDSLTIHAKMSLIHAISLHISKTASQQHKLSGVTVALPPALVETYSRLLVYPEIDTLGIKTSPVRHTKHSLTGSRVHWTGIRYCGRQSVPGHSTTNRL